MFFLCNVKRDFANAMRSQPETDNYLVNRITVADNAIRHFLQRLGGRPVDKPESELRNLEPALLRFNTRKQACSFKRKILTVADNYFYYVYMKGKTVMEVPGAVMNYMTWDLGSSDMLLHFYHNANEYLIADVAFWFVKSDVFLNPIKPEEEDGQNDRYVATLKKVEKNSDGNLECDSSDLRKIINVQEGNKFCQYIKQVGRMFKSIWKNLVDSVGYDRSKCTRILRNLDDIGLDSPEVFQEREYQIHADEIHRQYLRNQEKFRCGETKPELYRIGDMEYGMKLVFYAVFVSLILKYFRFIANLIAICKRVRPKGVTLMHAVCANELIDLKEFNDDTDPSDDNASLEKYMGLLDVSEKFACAPPIDGYHNPPYQLWYVTFQKTYLQHFERYLVTSSNSWLQNANEDWSEHLEMEQLMSDDWELQVHNEDMPILPRTKLDCWSTQYWANRALISIPIGEVCWVAWYISRASKNTAFCPGPKTTHCEQSFNSNDDLITTFAESDKEYIYNRAYRKWLASLHQHLKFAEIFSKDPRHLSDDPFYTNNTDNPSGSGMNDVDEGYFVLPVAYAGQGNERVGHSLLRTMPN
jgi:hypothetical protein